MSKKGKGVFALLTGIAAGAAAVFFSEKENRDKAQVVAKKAKAEARKVVTQAKKKATRVTKKK